MPHFDSLNTSAVQDKDLDARRTGSRQQAAISTKEEAIELALRSGVMSTWSSIGTLPRLSSYLASSDLGQIVWEVQEDFPRTRAGYYGKVLAAKGTLLSALSFADLASVAGSLDYRRQHKDGRLSPHALSVAQRLDKAGPLPTDELRASCGYGSKEKKPVFEAALADLQKYLLVTPIDQIQGNGRFKVPVWQLSSAWWDGTVAIDSDQQAALRRFLATLAAAADVLHGADVRSWLRPYGTSPQAALDELCACGLLQIHGRPGNGAQYVHAAG